MNCCFSIYFLLILLQSSAFCLVLDGQGKTIATAIVNQLINGFQEETVNSIIPLIINYSDNSSGLTTIMNTFDQIDFAVSDLALNLSELDSSENELVHIPVSLNAIVFVYNLQGIDAQINFLPETLSSIFQKNVSLWNDAAIVSSNPLITFPTQAINVAASIGTNTLLMSQFFSSSTRNWSQGITSSISEISNLTVLSEAEIANYIKNTPFSIGYTTLITAKQNNLNYVAIKNAHGEFVMPTSTTLKNTIMSIPVLPTGGDQTGQWATISLISTAIPYSYPITSLLYVLTYLDVSPKGQEGAALISFLNYIMESSVQQQLNDNYEASLPDSLISINQKTISQIVYDNSYSTTVFTVQKNEQDNSSSQSSGNGIIVIAFFCVITILIIFSVVIFCIVQKRKSEHEKRMTHILTHHVEIVTQQK